MLCLPLCCLCLLCHCCYSCCLLSRCLLRLALERELEGMRAELFRTQAEREALLKDMKANEVAWDELRYGGC